MQGVRGWNIFHINFLFHYYKIQHGEQGSHCFHYENYAQITSKQFHLLFVHDDNKSNSDKIGQVVAMGGSGKTQDFFLYQNQKKVISWNFFPSLFKIPIQPCLGSFMSHFHAYL